MIGMWPRRALLGVGLAMALFALLVSQLPGIGAGALLHPMRRRVGVPPPAGCESVTFQAEIGRLIGWRCPASGPRRGSVVYLHGVADNRASSAGVISRYARLGFDAVAFDSRAHGDSDGEFCTYGYFETEDLRRVLDTLAAGPVVLIGTSLGAAVALQHAARDPRVTALVAAEPFADLRTIAIERAPVVLNGWLIERALQHAERIASFSVDAVNPAAAARLITVPTLIVHGDADTDTRPEHARRVYDALSGPKRLLLVPGARHNESLRGEVWREIDEWIVTAPTSW